MLFTVPFIKKTYNLMQVDGGTENFFNKEHVSTAQHIVYTHTHTHKEEPQQISPSSQMAPYHLQSAQ